MKRRIFPRIYSSVFCSALLLSVVVLIGSTFVLAHTPDTNTIDSAAAAQWQAGGQRVQLEGELEIIHQDYKDGHGKFVYTLKQADGTRVPLQFVKHPPTHLLTGDHVTVSGQQSSSGLLLYSGANVSQTGGGSGGGSTSSIPVPYTFGPQQTLVILVNFEDDAVQPFTVADVQNEFFGTGNTLNSFVLENSYGQTSFTGDVAGWYTMPMTVAGCTLDALATYAQNFATSNGYKLANYTRQVYMFPQINACSGEGFGGTSTVGGNPSQTWLNGGASLQLLDHEMGHAFGLWHSHLLDCGTSAIDCSNGTVIEYGDLIDTMGTPQDVSFHYNAFQKERLGWLNYGSSPKIQTVTTSGTYPITDYETGAGPNALKILQSTDPTTGAKTWYYLEARQAIGWDSPIAPEFAQNETTGVLFHLGTDGNPSSSEVLDMTPATPTSNWYYDLALVVGQTFQDSAAGVTFAPTAVSSTGATIQITMNGGGSSCTAASPTVSVSPSQSQYVTSGTAVNFTATVINNDSSSCPAATFNLGDALPSGWAGVWSPAALSLSPGKSGSATLTVTSPAGTADGSYNVGVSATNASTSSYSGAAAATYVISTPGTLTVSLATNQSSYMPGQTVAVIVTMLNGTAPDAGANVTVAVTPPKGKTITLSGTTGSNGVALLNYNLSRHAAAGIYQAQYGATVTGASPTAGASTTFTVQ